MSINNIPNCLRSIEHEDVLYFTNGDLYFRTCLTCTAATAKPTTCVPSGTMLLRSFLDIARKHETLYQFQFLATETLT